MTYNSTIHSVDLAKYQPRARMMVAAELFDTNQPWGINRPLVNAVASAAQL